MRIFNQDGKINFVDENNVFLGYDTEQDCCEHAGWFVAAEPKADTAEQDPALLGGLEDYVFDTDYFQQVKGGPFEEGGMVIFRIENIGTGGAFHRYIHIFNSHNGYYGHGFEFKVPDANQASWANRSGRL